MSDMFARNGVSIERLRALWQVARAGGIMAAAAGDPNRQSLISRQLAELEEALGVQLLDRSVKPHRVTATGERLAQAHERFVREVADTAATEGSQRRPLTIGAGELVIREVLIPWIAKQRKRATNVSWVIRNLTSRKIQEELAAERLDVGLAAGLEAGGAVRIKPVASYGMKLMLPDGHRPDDTGWRRLAKTPVILLEGDGQFRRFLTAMEQDHGARLDVAAECTSYAQAVDLAEATGWAVFVPELWRRRRKQEWSGRTQPLPGLAGYRHTLQLGWNDRVARRREEVGRLVGELGKQKG